MASGGKRSAFDFAFRKNVFLAGGPRNRLRTTLPSSALNNNNNNSPSPTSNGSLCERRGERERCLQNPAPPCDSKAREAQQNWHTLRRGQHLAGLGRSRRRVGNYLATDRHAVRGRVGVGVRSATFWQTTGTPFVLARNWSRCELASKNSGAEETLPPIRRHCNKLLLCSRRETENQGEREGGGPRPDSTSVAPPSRLCPLAYILVTLLYTFAGYIHMGTYATIRKTKRAPRHSGVFVGVAKETTKNACCAVCPCAVLYVQ